MEKLVSENASSFPTGFILGDITSVSINTEKDFVAVALQDSDYSKNGAIVLLKYDGTFLACYQAGVQPDMVTCSGDYLLSADEGEPRLGYVSGVDPKGSVMVVDVSSGATTGNATIVDFSAFNNKRDALVQDHVILKKETNPDVDLEPEYITVEEDKAYVSLQEANAIATLDLKTKTFTSVKGLGFKDHSKAGNGLDLLEDGNVDIKCEDVYGVYMPDGIDSFTLKGVTYIATANEGDAREWGEFKGVKKKKIGSTKVEVLDNSLFDGLEEGKDYVLGGRSFSLFKAEDMSLVYDSGDLIESTIATSPYADYFNCSNDNITLDARSKKKGPEPESVLVEEIEGRLFAFVGLERISGIMSFDITDFVSGDVKVNDYTNTRDFSPALAGDVAPEGLNFIPSSDSPNGKNILVAANENSGTVAFYNVEDSKKTYTTRQNYVSKQAEAADHVLLYSAYGSGEKRDGSVNDNYIALKNPTQEDISLSGYSLSYARDGKSDSATGRLFL